MHFQVKYVPILAHWGRDKMAAILQTVFSDAFLWMKIFKFRLKFMMTSSNGIIFRVTGHLCSEFTGPRWILRTKASDAELWCFHYLTCTRINSCVNNREAGGLRRHRAHYDVTVMITLKFVPKCPIENILSLVLIMAWRRSGAKPLSEPMMVSLLTHIRVTRPRWINV